MTRIALAQLARSRLARLGGLVLAAFVLVAALADTMLASDLPPRLPVARHDLRPAPAVTHPAALDGVDCSQMRRQPMAGDWKIEPLVAFGPAAGRRRERAPAPLVQGHPFGTDAEGRDVFSRTVHGARTALGLGLGASAVLVLLGVLLGAPGGLHGRRARHPGDAHHRVVHRHPDPVVLVLIVGALVPHPTTAILLWTIALTRWTDLARMVRAEVLLALGADYVTTAARALGATPSPDPAPPCASQAPSARPSSPRAFGIASVVLIEAAVDFLHVGPADATASWGEALGQARGHPDAWWLIVFPGSALLAMLIALNLVGEAARDALDPRLRGVGEGAHRRAMRS